MGTAPPREALPPPVIGKVGRYTVFITPAQAPNSSESSRSGSACPAVSASPGKVSPSLEKAASSLPSTPPPVQVPPLQLEKPPSNSSASLFGFFWDAISKFQDAHASLDECLANWFGLNQSKYQWALDHYCDSNGREKEFRKSGKSKHIASEAQAI